MTYYFDALPLHPPPEHLESFTSYLTRLAEHNGILSMDGLSALCFQHQDRRITRDIADYPPTSLNDLARVSTWSEEILRTTTFFHLAAKFGRSTLPQPMSRFLSGCVGQYFRYCPKCFAEQRVKHNLLMWRFLLITCCHEHQCRLLEKCGHCGKLMSLFRPAFTLGNCSRCRNDLSQCAVALVSEKRELEAAFRTNEDILFLLTPQPWEEYGSVVIKRLGQQLAYKRQMKQLTAVEVASQLGVTLTTVEGIERGDLRSKGATFQGYIKYAHFLSCDLKEIFSHVKDEPDTVNTIPPPPCPNCQQNDYVTRYGYNRSGSQRYECHNCHRSFTARPKPRKLRKHSS